MGNSSPLSPSSQLKQIKKHAQLELSTPDPWMEVAVENYKECLPEFEEWLGDQGWSFTKTFPRNGVARYVFRRQRPENSKKQ